jgi:DNA topoisomerase III
MDIMEELYREGLLSYPRTETTAYNPTINLREIVKQFKQEGGDTELGAFANKMLTEGLYGGPRNGNKDDKAHPPIHPVKFADKAEIQAMYKSKNEKNKNDDSNWKIYDLICRHFLASLSRDAVGSQTLVEVTLANEVFSAKGLKIESKNYLEIYDKWETSDIPDLKEGQILEDAELFMKEGKTTPPSYLTESDLISLMDENGIGTDATIHQHIATIL